jgi:predicted MPP superfamily phosphohydrolase
MNLFLLTFFILYGSLHLYVFLKAKAAFVFSTQTSIYLALIMMVMVVAPIVVRLSERTGLEFFARLISYIGYTWMGLLFLFVSVSLVVDLYRFIVYLSGFILKIDFPQITLSNKNSFLAILILSALIVIYGYVEARNIRTEKVVIKTSKIPEEIGRLKIVQISDVHLGLIVGEERLKRILKEVKLANPDILVSTGDLVDGQIDNLHRLAKLLKEINPRFGKFAITGNHEFYAGLSRALNFTEKAGFKILRGERLTVAGVINIAGVDDPAGKTQSLYKDIPERELLSGLPHKKFTILLKHRPVVDKCALGLFDLQLSGHAHKGQIFPFSLITKLYYPADSGCLNLVDNFYMYVNRGAGTWGPPIRFLSPPEVTVVELVHEDGK